MNSFRVSTADALADISEDDLRQLQRPEPTLPLSAPDAWWEKFQYDQYDWDDPAFVAQNVGPFAYKPVRLTQGYFMMVSPDRYKDMTQFPDGRKKRWRAKIHRDRQTDEITAVYAQRVCRKGFDCAYLEGVVAHRELLGIIESPLLLGDHQNGWGLDNRHRKRQIVNLAAVKKDANTSNTIRARADDLPSGVERYGSAGNYRYGGKACIRISKDKVVTIRTKRKWRTPGPAAQWYQNYLKRRHNRETWVHNPGSVNYPIFPPLLREVRAARETTQPQQWVAPF